MLKFVIKFQPILSIPSIEFMLHPLQHSGCQYLEFMLYLELLFNQLKLMSIYCWLDEYSILLYLVSAQLLVSVYSTFES